MVRADALYWKERAEESEEHLRTLYRICQFQYGKNGVAMPFAVHEAREHLLRCDLEDTRDGTLVPMDA